MIIYYNNYVERQQNCMYLVHLAFLCANESSEFLTLNTEQEEFSMEDLAGQFLLTLFDGVMVDEVCFNKTDSLEEQTPLYMLSVNARCPHHVFPSSYDEVALLENKMESTVSGILTELFSTVYVEQVEVKFMPLEEECCA